jgi:hypothetical protein
MRNVRIRGYYLTKLHTSLEPASNSATPPWSPTLELSRFLPFPVPFRPPQPLLRQSSPASSSTRFRPKPRSCPAETTNSPAHKGDHGESRPAPAHSAGAALPEVSAGRAGQKHAEAAGAGSSFTCVTANYIHHELQWPEPACPRRSLWDSVSLGMAEGVSRPRFRTLFKVYLRLPVGEAE